MTIVSCQVLGILAGKVNKLCHPNMGKLISLLIDVSGLLCWTSDHKVGISLSNSMSHQKKKFKCPGKTLSRVLLYQVIFKLQERINQIQIDLKRWPGIIQVNVPQQPHPLNSTRMLKVSLFGPQWTLLD